VLGAVVLSEHLSAPALLGAGLVLGALVALAVRPPLVTPEPAPA
jgi:hypothetical protein